MSYGNNDVWNRELQFLLRIGSFKEQVHLKIIQKLISRSYFTSKSSYKLFSLGYVRKILPEIGPLAKSKDQTGQKEPVTTHCTPRYLIGDHLHEILKGLGN